MAGAQADAAQSEREGLVGRQDGDGSGLAQDPSPNGGRGAQISFSKSLISRITEHVHKL